MLPRAILFDLDGTLLDTLDDVTLLLGRALAMHGLPPAPASAVRARLGDGARSLVARTLGLDEHDVRVDPVLASYRSTYEADPTPRTRLMPHAEELLAWAGGRGIALAVCTNKPAAVAREVVARTMPRVFAVVVGQGDTPRAKPAPDLLDLALGRLGVAPSEALMVGDAPQDVFAGRAAGTRTAALRNGYGDAEALLRADADEVFDDLEGLRRWLACAPAGSR